jgi:hypothetical protein
MRLKIKKEFNLKVNSFFHSFWWSHRESNPGFRRERPAS